MKKSVLIFAAVMTIILFACQKSENASQVSLTPSATEVTVGEQMSVTVSTSANVSNWTVTPSTAVAKTYGLTTSKVNYFTFSEPGTYTIGVQAKSIAYDSTRQSLQSCWNQTGAGRSRCTPGVDSASVKVVVTGK
jgi:uncharacterized secreted protein with C-terminal beta-propeller domain